jgi:hypothetical protein
MATAGGAGGVDYKSTRLEPVTAGGCFTKLSAKKDQEPVPIGVRVNETLDKRSKQQAPPEMGVHPGGG